MLSQISISVYPIVRKGLSHPRQECGNLSPLQQGFSLLCGHLHTGYHTCKMFFFFLNFSLVVRANKQEIYFVNFNAIREESLRGILELDGYAWCTSTAWVLGMHQIL